MAERSFVDLNEQNIVKLLLDKDSVNIKRIIEMSVKLFSSFLQAKKLDSSTMHDKITLDDMENDEIRRHYAKCPEYFALF